MWMAPDTPPEMLRENKRMLDKAIRDVDRERMALQNQEKKLVTEIKKLAKQNQMDAVRVLAKSLVRNRHAVTKLYQLKSQLQAVSLRIQVRMLSAVHAVQTHQRRRSSQPKPWPTPCAAPPRYLVAIVVHTLA